MLVTGRAMASPPSPPSSSSQVYYSIVAVAMIVFLLLLYNAIAVGCFSRCYPAGRRGRRSEQTNIQEVHIPERVWNRFQELIPSTKYKKEGTSEESNGECSVCLSVFEEGEDIRKLPRCHHSFHAPCIDMWLYSHSSCPLCRASVLMLPQYLPGIAVPNSRERSQSGSSTAIGIMVASLV